MAEPKTYIARDPIALTPHECVQLLRELQAVLFVEVADNDSDAIVEEWNPDKPWDAKVQEDLGALMTRWQLRPRELEDGGDQYDREASDEDPLASIPLEVQEALAKRRAERDRRAER